ncbi:uncharacterized protein VTP21DRAFT_1228 [Calcarisporiella thermophila]|uniref:uncharacterized protein n=1 Tax=Calcarisporiella thermophila TaxID=911321 RepID=UPI0037446A31
MATLDTAHNYSPTVIGLGYQFGLAASITLVCVLGFEWNRSNSSMAFLYTARCKLEKNSTPPLSSRFLSWVPKTLSFDESFYLTHVGLDATMYLRFLGMACRFLLLNSIIVGATLLPLHYYGVDSSLELDRLSVANIADGSSLLWAHAFGTYVVACSWMYLCYVNWFDYMNLRDWHILQRVKQGDVTVRTVMVRHLPPEHREEAQLKTYFENLGFGAVQSVAVVRPVNKLCRKLRRRETILNAMETWQIQTARKIISTIRRHHTSSRWKEVAPTASPDTHCTIGEERFIRLISDMVKRHQKKYATSTGITARRTKLRRKSLTHPHDHEAGSPSSAASRSSISPFGSWTSSNIWEAIARISPRVLAQYQPPLPLPRRLWKIRLSQDSLDCASSIQELYWQFENVERRIVELRQHELATLPVSPPDYSGDTATLTPRNKSTCIAFITFENIKSAQMCAQSIVHWKPGVCVVEMAPEPRDVSWDDVINKWKSRWIRSFLVNIAVWSLIIFWLFPITFILGLTSLDTMSKHFIYLGPIVDTTPFFRMLIQNVLPTVLVTLFMALLPWMLMEVSKLECSTSYSMLERKVLKRYYYFSIFNVLLVFLLGKTFLTSILSVLYQPTSLLEVLAITLPEGSSFFINYVVFNTCTHALELLQFGTQLFSCILLTNSWVSKTPRILAQNSKPWSFPYYYYYPNHILVFVIVLTYSVISPLILFFGLLYFALAYLVFRYQFAYAYVRRYEANGRFYRLMYRYTTDGLIIFELTMLGLLWVKRALIPGAILIPLIFSTFSYKFMIKRRFFRRTRYFPADQSGLEQHEGNIRDVKLGPRRWNRVFGWRDEGMLFGGVWPFARSLRDSNITKREERSSAPYESMSSAITNFRAYSPGQQREQNRVSFSSRRADFSAINIDARILTSVHREDGEGEGSGGSGRGLHRRARSSSGTASRRNPSHADGSTTSRASAFVHGSADARSQNSSFTMVQTTSQSCSPLSQVSGRLGSARIPSSQTTMNSPFQSDGSPSAHAPYSSTMGPIEQSRQSNERDQSNSTDKTEEDITRLLPTIKHRLVYHDDPTAVQTYVHPALSKSLSNRFLLPRNPMRPFNLDDCIELDVHVYAALARPREENYLCRLSETGSISATCSSLSNGDSSPSSMLSIRSNASSCCSCGRRVDSSATADINRNREQMDADESAEPTSLEHNNFFDPALELEAELVTQVLLNERGRLATGGVSGSIHIDVPSPIPELEENFQQDPGGERQGRDH